MTEEPKNKETGGFAGEPFPEIADSATEPGPSLDPPEPSSSVPEPDPASSTPPASDGFQPYYPRETRFRTVTRAVHFLLLFILGTGLIAWGVAVVTLGLPYRLEAVAVVLITAALIGLLWKMTTLQARVGLALLGLSLAMMLSFGLHPSLPFGPFGPETQMGVAGYHLILILALIWAAWQVFAKPWPSLVFSLLLLYAALAPVWTWVQAPSDQGFWLNPPFLAQIPFFLAPGWILAQVLLPLGFLAFLALQGRNLFVPQFDKHWGFVLWAFSLALAATLGLLTLERSDRAVWPALSQPLARLVPASAPVAPTAAASKPSPPAAGPAVSSPAAPPSTPAEPPAPSAAGTSSPTEPPAFAKAPGEPTVSGPADAAKPSSPPVAGAAPSTTPQETVPPFPEPSAPATGLTPPVASSPGTGPEGDVGQAPKPETEGPPPVSRLHPSQAAELGELRARVRELEAAMGNLQDRLDAQERLIRALLEYFGPNGERTEGTDDSEDAYEEENGADDEPEDDSEDETDPKTT